MDENTMELEQEMDMPKDWKTDRVLCRNSAGVVFELEVPDDPEEVSDLVDDY